MDRVCRYETVNVHEKFSLHGWKFHVNIPRTIIERDKGEVVGEIL